MFQIVSGKIRGEKSGCRERNKGGKSQNELEKRGNFSIFERKHAKKWG